MSLTLPLQANLEHLRRQAKDLLQAHQRGEVAVCATLRGLRHLTHAADDAILAASLTLRQAQHALAHAYGFSNWAALKAAVEARAAVRAVTGGCFCGRVRYEITDPAPKASVCHCVGCRRASAAPAVAWITVPADAFRLTQGELRSIRGTDYPPASCDGHGGVREFCPSCGTHLTFRADDRAGEVDITTGSLDDPARFPPTETSFGGEKLPWMPSLLP
jgi:hypothetical protein